MNQTIKTMRSNDAPKARRPKGHGLPLRQMNAVAYAAALEVLG
ncbi:MAG: hypothetical protein ABIO43_08065 [Sphingomicrobium sp.]